MKTRNMTFGALCLALSLLLPQVFHLVGMQQAGQIFLPMHIPVFIAGLLLGPWYGIFLGVSAPLLSCVLTGMPSAERVLFMMMELTTYGFFSGLFFQTMHVREKRFGALTSLLAAMALGRVVYGLGLTIASSLMGMPLGSFAVVWASVISGIPGIVMQLALLPVLVRVVEKGGFLYGSYASVGNSQDM